MVKKGAAYDKGTGKLKGAKGKPDGLEKARRKTKSAKGERVGTKGATKQTPKSTPAAPKRCWPGSPYFKEFRSLVLAAVAANDIDGAGASCPDVASFCTRHYSEHGIAPAVFAHEFKLKTLLTQALPASGKIVKVNTNPVRYAVAKK